MGLGMPKALSSVGPRFNESDWQAVAFLYR